MKLTNKQIVAGIVFSTTLLLSACGDSGTGTSVGASTDSESSGSDSDVISGTGDSTDLLFSDNFEFPALGQAAGILTPTGPAPEFSARRTLSNGAGSAIEFGDPVVLKYNMYSWSTGELVESTDTLDGPLTIRAGVTNGVPEYLTKSLLGRQIGDTLQVVFERGMADLPEYLDNSDAYVLVVELI